MSIIYKNNKDIPCDCLYSVFYAVGWVDQTKDMTSEMLNNFNKPFINSTIVYSAWDEGKMVGCVRALSDRMFRSVILDLAVLPEYQGWGDWH